MKQWIRALVFNLGAWVLLAVLYTRSFGEKNILQAVIVSTCVLLLANLRRGWRQLPHLSQGLSPMFVVLLCLALVATIYSSLGWKPEFWKSTATGIEGVLLLRFLLSLRPRRFS